MEIPGRNIRLEVTPAIEAQELASGSSTGIIYWEGAVNAQGLRDGKKVKGRGDVELTGSSLYGRALLKRPSIVEKIAIDMMLPPPVVRMFGGGEAQMEILLVVSVTTAVLWLAFGNKKDWSGM